MKMDTNTGGKPGAKKKAAEAPPGKVKAPSQPPLIWNEFSKWCARSGMERLSPTFVKGMEKRKDDGDIPKHFVRYFNVEVKGNRIIPQSNLLIVVPGLPQGFPEFCVFVADGISRKAATGFPPGLEGFAEFTVNEIRDDQAKASPITEKESEPARAPAHANGGAVGELKEDSFADAAVTRRRARRLNKKMSGRRGGGGVGGEDFAANLHAAISNLDGNLAGNETKGGEDGGQGKRLQEKMALVGDKAEDVLLDERRKALGNLDTATDQIVDKVGESEADALGMRGVLERAIIYRRRADRVQQRLEDQMNSALLRMVRMEAQYKAMVQLVEGEELSLPKALDKAAAAIKAGTEQECGKAGTVKALEYFGEAVKCLEVHVGKKLKTSGEDPEARARHLLYVALCNRSIANYTLGNLHNGKVDADWAVEIWGEEMSSDIKAVVSGYETVRGTVVIAKTKWEVDILKRNYMGSVFVATAYLNVEGMW
ncbi:unnamed protein product [Choristocarpus tenellus]